LGEAQGPFRLAQWRRFIGRSSMRRADPDHLDSATLTMRTTWRNRCQWQRACRTL
jgi:hypothetical protein